MDVDRAGYEGFTQAYPYEHKRMHGLDVSVDRIFVAPPLSKPNGNMGPHHKGSFCVFDILIVTLKNMRSRRKMSTTKSRFVARDWLFQMILILYSFFQFSSQKAKNYSVSQQRVCIGHCLQGQRLLMFLSTWRRIILLEFVVIWNLLRGNTKSSLQVEHHTRHRD